MRGGSEPLGFFSSSSSRSGAMTGLSVTGLMAALVEVPPHLILETCRETQGNTARRTDCISRKQPSKINHVHNVSKIRPVHLKAHIQPLRFVYVCPCRCTHLKSGVDTPLREVDAINDLLTVCLDFSSGNSNGNPLSNWTPPANHKRGAS
jgi:hypothetical protein